MVTLAIAVILAIYLLIGYAVVMLIISTINEHYWRERFKENEKHEEDEEDEL